MRFRPHIWFFFVFHLVFQPPIIFVISLLKSQGTEKLGQEVSSDIKEQLYAFRALLLSMSIDQNNNDPHFAISHFWNTLEQFAQPYDSFMFLDQKMFQMGLGVVEEFPKDFSNEAVVQNSLPHGFSYTLSESNGIWWLSAAISTKYPKQKNLPAFIRVVTQVEQIPYYQNVCDTILIFLVIMFFIISVIISRKIFSKYVEPLDVIINAVQSYSKADFSYVLPIPRTERNHIDVLLNELKQLSRNLNLKTSVMEDELGRLRSIFIGIIEGVLITNKNGELILINDPIRKLLEIPPLSGAKPVIEIVRNIEIRDTLDAVLKSGEPVSKEILFLHKGEEYYLQANFVPIQTSNMRNRIDGVVAVFHDLTQIRKLETMRQEFIANVSHELKTPLTSIKGYAETLLTGAINDSANAYNFLKIIEKNSNQLEMLIEDILSIAKLESTRNELLKQPTAIKMLVQEILLDYELEANQHHIILQNAIDDNLPLISLDKEKIATAIKNLIENAIRYNKPHGSVTIRGTIDASKFHLTIEDSGIGIPEKEQERIFERFYRVDKGRSRHMGGTGLGLSIVKHVIKAHNGSVLVSSELGKGSTFFISIPIEK